MASKILYSDACKMVFFALSKIIDKMIEVIKRIVYRGSGKHIKLLVFCQIHKKFAAITFGISEMVRFVNDYYITVPAIVIQFTVGYAPFSSKIRMALYLELFFEKYIVFRFKITSDIRQPDTFLCGFWHYHQHPLLVVNTFFKEHQPDKCLANTNAVAN